jgi:hypothetical protein
LRMRIRVRQSACAQRVRTSILQESRGLTLCRVRVR